jgi:ABC-2 type transport system ATP-binding protein
VIVRTSGLSKHYGRRRALDGVDLAVPEGAVYGLVGPNGSGKTTLISILAGLRRASAGQVAIGVERAKVAVLPDTPHFDPWLSAREVVALASTLVLGDAWSERIDEALAAAGLLDDAERRCGGFSRGMLQRLGLASTLVTDPDFVMLDEPASALDPAGRREVLDLVARLRGRTTVLFSSHILGDVQQVCDTVGILRAGELLFQGPLDELLVGRAGPVYRVELRGEPERVAEQLRGQPWVAAVEQRGRGTLRVTAGSLGDAERSLAGALDRAGAQVVSLGPESADLEAVFLELTS